MARIRTIKPDFWKHEELSALPEATHMLAAALLNYADDYGYFNANPKLIKADCSPLREPSVSIPESLRSLQTIGWLRLGRGVDGRCYGHIVTFDTHQRVSHPTASKIKEITISWEDSGKIPEPSVSPPDIFVPEGNKEKEKKEKKDGAIAPLELPEARYFRRVREILGPTAGGLGKKLLRAKGSIPAAMAALELASGAGDAHQYIGRIIAGRRDPELPEVIPR